MSGVIDELRSKILETDIGLSLHPEVASSIELYGLTFKGYMFRGARKEVSSISMTLPSDLSEDELKKMTEELKKFGYTYRRSLDSIGSDGGGSLAGNVHTCIDYWGRTELRGPILRRFAERGPRAFEYTPYYPTGAGGYADRLIGNVLTSGVMKEKLRTFWNVDDEERDRRLKELAGMFSELEPHN